jgi:CxxC motif-containing protein
MKKEFVCINCPRGCMLTVDTETLEVKGNSCPRGEAYGKAEVTNPVRTVTSTVKIVGG